MMKKKLIIFLALVTAFSSALPLMNLASKGAINRLQRAIRVTPLDALPSILAKQLLDTAPIVHALNRLSWKSGIHAGGDQVVVGKNGWMHLGDAYADSITSHRRGEMAADRLAAAAVSDNIRAWQAWLREHGVDTFTIVVAPDKQSVYPETTPDWVQTATRRRVDDLFSGTASNVFLDPLKNLSQAKAAAGHDLYYKTDSHWNYLGGAYAFQALGRHLKAQSGAAAGEWHWPTDAPPLVTRVRHQLGKDQARLIGVTAAASDTAPVVQLEGLVTRRPQVLDFDTGRPLQRRPSQDASRTLRSVLHIRNAEAKNQQKVVWAHDSFGAGMAPFMHASFADLVELNIREALSPDRPRLVDIVQDWKPSHVIITVVERNALLSVMNTPAPRASSR